MTKSDQVWRDLAKRLESRRVELDPRYKNLSEFSRATGVNYKTLQRAEGGRPHPFGRSTLVELDVAYGYRPGSIEAILDGGDPVDADGADPLAASHARAPEDEEWDGYLVGEPHLRPGETLQWQRLEPRAGQGRIRYVMTYIDPVSGSRDSADHTFSDERDISFVVQYFRELKQRYSGPASGSNGHRE